MDCMSGPARLACARSPAVGAADDAGNVDGKLFELRQYHVRPGQQAAWVKCMEEEIIPLQGKMGMVILGTFVGEQDESIYVWLRRFESEEARVKLYDAVYGSDQW